MKASAFLDALSRPRGESLPSTEQPVTPEATSTRVLLVDHEVRTYILHTASSVLPHCSPWSFLQDSFVHTLANYMRQTGATVVTLRAGFTEAQLDEVSVQRRTSCCCRFCRAPAQSCRVLNSAVRRLDCGSQVNPQLVFLSPGPGSPTDFKLSTTIEMAQRRKLPIFGVCLGAPLWSCVYNAVFRQAVCVDVL